ncbi:unnamed protein product [Mytilus coruscus]|uniref:DNA2/NAM7 helicase helicase domain-containing protein n=1 Tax=Mytilus coruscus TaxID=42192 RepID=A0A6J8EW38_MYTCO|nr:unnamed protein product [Mytilus coruscus]
MIKLTDIDHWSSTEELGMDESQRTAFISALTEEFVLIQEPPGTGQSYIGLQITRTLLHNKDKWKMKLGCYHYGGSNEKHQCILIVCYTNHALDQFVEGIIKCIPEKELTDVIPAVVRIGNQSKNETVEKYSIKNQRYKMHKRKHAQDVLRLAERTRIEILNARAILKVVREHVLFFISSS